MDSVSAITVGLGHKGPNSDSDENILSEFLITVFQLLLKILHSPSGSQASCRSLCACQVPAAAMPACLLLAFIWVVCFFVCTSS